MTKTRSNHGALHFLGVCWRFLRPHTIYGTIAASISWTAKALIENPNELPNILKALPVIFALICANGYGVGIDQIHDINIDKINKPYLPIVAGDLTVQTAWTLCLSFATMGLLTVIANHTPSIVFLYCLCLFLVTLYSVPPFRLKRFAVLSFLIIASVRGPIVNYMIYSSLKAAQLGFSFQWTTPMTFITASTTLFAFVVGITKDLSDVEGDRKYKILTFATKFGVKNVALFGSGLLLVNYMAALGTAILVPESFKHFPMIPTYLLLALSLVVKVWLLDNANYTKEACVKFYRFIWYLFYAQYMLFPLI